MIEDYFILPSVDEFANWNPIATPYRIWVNAYMKSVRIYENNGNLYVKFPFSEWRRIETSISYDSTSYSTTIDRILPITLDKA